MNPSPPSTCHWKRSKTGHIRARFLGKGKKLVVASAGGILIL